MKVTLKKKLDLGWNEQTQQNCLRKLEIFKLKTQSTPGSTFTRFIVNFWEIIHENNAPSLVNAVIFFRF